MKARTEINPSHRFGYRTNLIQSCLESKDRNFFTELQGRFPGQAIALINAVGDGNCGPRAVIQSLLVRGVAGEAWMQPFVSAFLQRIYQQQHDQLDSRHRSLYGCVLRRQSAVLPADLVQHRNSCVLVDNVLYCIDFDGQVKRIPIADMAAFEQTFNRIQTSGFAALGVDTSATVRLTYDELNQLTGGNPRIDFTDRLKASVQAFLSSYSSIQPGDLGQLRDDYFGNMDVARDGRAIHDDVIYVLAGCLRFDMEAYIREHPAERLIAGQLSSEGRGVTQEHALNQLRQLEEAMDFNDLVGYFPDHGIHCTLDGAAGLAPKTRLVDTNESRAMLLGAERFANDAPQIDISIYRSGGHFMSLFTERKDSALRVMGTAASDEPVVAPTTSSVAFDEPVAPSSTASPIFLGQAALDVQLAILEEKALQLRREGYVAASAAAYRLHRRISDHAKQFFGSTLALGAFQLECAEAINQERPALEKRGWKEILGNLALAILGVGVFYAAACVINKDVTGRFLFFRPDAAQKLDVLEARIAEVSCVAA